MDKRKRALRTQLFCVLYAVWLHWLYLNLDVGKEIIFLVFGELMIFMFYCFCLYVRWGIRYNEAITGIKYCDILMREYLKYKVN